MGLFDGLTGSRAADAGVSPVPAAELKAALLALNSDTSHGASPRLRTTTTNCLRLGSSTSHAGRSSSLTPI
jgi:hypothetical protein